MIQGFIFYDNIKKKCLFELAEPLTFQLSNGEQTYIPVQYRTDFATVPQWARSVINVLDKHYKACILHDWLYDNQYKSRKFADDEFLKAMKKHGVKKWKRNLMWFAVRVGGRNRWRT
jgi:hypothetical protein